jgi:hypothetical protein
MPIVFLHIAHYLSRIVSDAAFEITLRWSVLTLTLVSAYWHGHYVVSTGALRWRRWLYYGGTMAIPACLFPEAVPIIFLAMRIGDAAGRKHNAAIKEAI